MNIFLDSEVITLDESSPDSKIGELIDLIEPELEKQGRTLVEINIDGVSYLPENRSEFDQKCIADIEKIEMISASVREILMEAVADGGEAFDYLERLALDIASDVRIGKIKEAMERLVELVDGLGWLTTVLQQIALGFARQMMENTLEDRRQRLFARFTEHMTALKGAQESQDWVGLADILEYEFPDIFKESREFFKELQAKE
ncbi:MAG: hypothetical protein HQM09_00540 [Candidatus Riflebacteria bacterium]|nr:hypothetical protein [Candidatus Riflebacteria bacterium]